MHTHRASPALSSIWSNHADTSSTRESSAAAASAGSTSRELDPGGHAALAGARLQQRASRADAGVDAVEHVDEVVLGELVRGVVHRRTPRVPRVDPQPDPLRPSHLFLLQQVRLEVLPELFLAQQLLHEVPRRAARADARRRLCQCRSHGAQRLGPGSTATGNVPPPGHGASEPGGGGAAAGASLRLESELAAVHWLGVTRSALRVSSESDWPAGGVSAAASGLWRHRDMNHDRPAARLEKTRAREGTTRQRPAKALLRGA
eukprot:188710-Rhodomonas_salina.3